MGRLLILLGMAMIGFGVYGMMSAFRAPAIPNISETIDASQFCREGEKLEEEGGASSYTPGQGYGRNVQYYCVSADGERRDITDEFNENLVSGVSGMISGFTNMFSIDFRNIGLIGGGIVVLIIGFIVTSRRRMSMRMMDLSSGLVDSPIFKTTTTVGRVPPEVARYVQQAREVNSFASIGTPVQPGAGGDLSTKLKQLDEAKSAGLISQEEYDRLRQQILDQMK